MIVFVPGVTCHVQGCTLFWIYFPGDFITKVKQINSQSDLISMSTFAGLSYLTIRLSVCTILIWDPCICNLHNLCQTGFSYIRRKPHQQRALNFNEQILRVHFLQLQPSIRPIPARVILLWKGPPKLCIECHLVPLWAFPPRSPGSVWKSTAWYHCWKKISRRINTVGKT